MTKTSDLTLVILPGNSPKNKEWAISAHGAFMSMFKSVVVDEYDHWNKNREESIDLNLEANKLAKIIESANRPIEIFAKSAGTILVLYAVHYKIISASQIHKCVFVGFPLTWALDNGLEISTWSENYDIPTILIQNDLDPVASASDIKAEQSRGYFKGFELIVQKGNDHVYGNFDDISKYL